MLFAAVLLALHPQMAEPVRLGEEELARYREALGAFPSQGVELVGRAELHGTKARLRWQLAGDGRFRREILGPLDKVTGFDGAACWQMDDSGVPHDVALYGREFWVSESGVLAGIWCDPKGPFDCFQGAEGVLQVRLRGGRLRGLLEIDPDSGRPRSWQADESSGATGLEFVSWQYVMGVHVPREVIAYTAAGLVSRYSIEEVRPLSEPAFGRPRRGPTRASFDPDVPSGVSMRTASTGHLFVRPRLHGQDVGWFLFDTAAGISVVDASVAERLGMEAVGRRAVSGAGAGVQGTTLRAGGALTLGPLTLERMIWNEIPHGYGLEQLARLVDGEPVGGLLGFDLLIHCVAELDADMGRLALHDPERYVLPDGGRWEPMILHRRQPHVAGRFREDAEGWFCLDSGAGDLSVSFHTPTVLEYGLLAEAEHRELRAIGAGGAFLLRKGTIDWFEVGGRRFEGPTVFFSQERSGSLADPWTAGTLGHAFFAGLTLTFDYGGGRVGIFAP